MGFYSGSFKTINKIQKKSFLLIINSTYDALTDIKF